MAKNDKIYREAYIVNIRNEFIIKKVDTTITVIQNLNHKCKINYLLQYKIK